MYYYYDNYYNNDYLQHYGVKGMKWGVRRALKKEAKQQYRKAKADARNAYSVSKKKADSAYEKSMAKKNKALDDVMKKYNIKQKTIDEQYEDEIDEHQRKVDAAERDLEWYGEDSFFEKGYYRNEYNKASKDLADAQKRYDEASYANRIVRDQAAVKVRDLYYKQSEAASMTREAAYAKAGDEYVKSLNLARQTYKEAKRNIKKKSAETHVEETGKKITDAALKKEEKKLVKDLMDTYDKSDPDYEEAMEILREIDEDFD